MHEYDVLQIVDEPRTAATVGCCHTSQVGLAYLSNFNEA